MCALCVERAIFLINIRRQAVLQSYGKELYYIVKRAIDSGRLVMTGGSSPPAGLERGHVLFTRLECEFGIESRGTKKAPSSFYAMSSFQHDELALLRWRDVDHDHTLYPHFTQHAWGPYDLTTMRQGLWIAEVEAKRETNSFDVDSLQSVGQPRRLVLDVGQKYRLCQQRDLMCELLLDESLLTICEGQFRRARVFDL